MKNKNLDGLMPYEQPTIEIVTFELDESIATSSDFGSATLCGEEIY